MKMDKKETVDIPIEQKKQIAIEISEYVWRILHLDWDETVDNMDMYDFENKIRKML